MRLASVFRLVGRALSKPPGLVARRLVQEGSAQLDRYLAPGRARRFELARLLQATGDPDLDSLWRRLATRPYPAHTSRVDPAQHRLLCPGDEERILALAADAAFHRVSLLGSGPVKLGTGIDWSRDFKSHTVWPRRYMRDIVYVNPDDASDVKVPWELSRLQWLMPAGQAYLLTGEEGYARVARDVLQSWIDANPYAQTVNWSCTMEAALRILTWTWFFRVFHASRAWQDSSFRERFLCTLYLHGDFTERHIELSDVNGNHCTADAAGLVFAGLFFGRGKDAARWLTRGWSLLCTELPRQVFADGVDFEGSLAYHRLVAELFLLPALYRRASGLDVPESYREQLIRMARFSAVYSRPDGSTPLWGDADDARALPFGRQEINDHRYLAGLVATALDAPELKKKTAGPRGEAFWLLGPEAAASLPAGPAAPEPPGSSAFREGGFYVMRNPVDHVFIDCGPVGTAGRGGHGHNDCLAFEAVLAGVRLVSDCGAFVYTASFEERNRFRSTAAHNTPRIDGQEINRFEPDLLWSLTNDARPEVRSFDSSTQRDRFVGSHSGYLRLAAPVRPVRSVELDHQRHALLVQDSFEGSGRHLFEVPLHLAPGVEASARDAGLLELRAAGRQFELAWQPADAWRLEIGAGRVSPSYGVAVPVVRLLFWREGAAEPSLSLRLAPTGGG